MNHINLINHKNKFNSMESSAGHLKMNEIRCPYCRKKHAGVLPYYEELNLEKVCGVNHIDLTKTYTNSYVGTSYKQCESLIINLNHDPSGNEPDELIQCTAYGSKLPPHFNDTKHYCYLHKKSMIKKYKNEEYMKLKLAKQQAKDILIAEVKKAKEEANQKLKEEKQKTKEEKEKTQKLKDELANLVKESKTNKKIKKSSGLTKDNENVVVGSSQILPSSETTNNKGCIELLKTGLNKGNKCGCKVYNGDYCKRHFKLSINEV